MAGYERFQRIMLAVATNHIGRGIQPHEREFQEVFWNHLLDRAGTHVLERKLAADERFFTKIWQGFLEISGSLKTLQDVEVYIRRFPYSKTSITRHRYLRYHIESHFNEIYILRERLKTFLTIIERLYRKDPRHSNILRVTQAMAKLVTDMLEGVTTTRSSHIHQSRFQSEDLNRLESLDLLTSVGINEVSDHLRLYYDNEYRSIRRSWRMTLKSNNEAIIKLLNIYFKRLLPIIFNESEKELNYPQSSRT